MTARPPALAARPVRQHDRGVDDEAARARVCWYTMGRRPVATPLGRIPPPKRVKKLHRYLGWPCARGRARCAPRTRRTTWTTGRPRGPGGRPRSRSAGPWVSPSDIRRARGAGASSRPGVRLALTQTPKKGLFSSPRGLRRAPGRPGYWLNRSEPFYTTIGPRGATCMPQITATGPLRPGPKSPPVKNTYFDPLFHMRSSTRAAYAPPAARTRHISRGDTR